MTLKKYFRSELKFLKEEGIAFSKVNPHLTKYLSDESIDPEVERLLEGFAFLSGRLRQKIEDDFPELTHSMLNLLWPNYLRPIPSCTIMQFEPKDKTTTEKQVLPKGTAVESMPVDGIQCKFSTCMDLPIYPLKLSSAELSNTQEKSVIALTLNTLSEQPLNSMRCDDLSIHLSGDEYSALTCYAWMFNYLTNIHFVFGEKRVSVNLSSLENVGFSSDEALLPYPKNAFDGYRILQEFFAFPKRFCFIKLTQLQKVWPNESLKNLKIEFSFSRAMPDDINISSKDFSLHCVPAINIFQHGAEPITLNGKESKYRLRPSGKQKHYEMFSVDGVVGMEVDKVSKSIKGERKYVPFESFEHEVERVNNRVALYYKIGIHDRIDESGFDHNVSFSRGDEVALFGKDETISIDLSCTNRDLPKSLAVGEVCLPSEGTPSFVTFKNILRPTPSVRPVLDGSLHWTLISNLSLNYLSLLEADLLKNVIRSYDFLAMHDIQSKRRTTKRLNAIQDIKTSPTDILFKGLPIRGIQSQMKVNGQEYSCEGELFLFGTVLSNFFGLYASINSFHVLNITNSANNETYHWGIQKGRQPVI